MVAAGAQSAALVDEAVKAGFPKDRISHVKDSSEAGRAAQRFVQPGDLVLLKGSRGMQMEKTLECFTSSYTR